VNEIPVQKTSLDQYAINVKKSKRIYFVKGKELSDAIERRGILNFRPHVRISSY